MSWAGGMAQEPLALRTVGSKGINQNYNATLLLT